MSEETNPLSPNSLAFIALANEFCHALENVFEYDDRQAFIAEMLKLLPRLYISASDIKTDNEEDGGMYLDSALDENSYNSVMSNVSRIMGEDDIYLEVFIDDMKYSDTPISSSISENLADIYQPLYNLIATVKDSPDTIINDAILSVKADFNTYWGQSVCNVTRALHSIYYKN